MQALRNLSVAIFLTSLAILTGAFLLGKARLECRMSIETEQNGLFIVKVADFVSCGIALTR